MQLTTNPPPESHDASVQHVERLLSAVNRLRAERDGLRRDVQFLQTESRFTIESLETRLAHAQLAPQAEVSAAPLENIQRLSSARDCVHHVSLAASAFAAVVSHQDDQLILTNQSLLTVENSRTHLIDQLSAMQEMTDKLRAKKDDVEALLSVTASALELAEREKDEGNERLQTKERAWRDELGQYKGDMEHLSLEVKRITKNLEVVEGERDSFKVQIANLMSELQGVRDELASAENRYTALQFHQLSSMSNHEATRTLRQQIQDLESRVVRRTEQIGMHQHDIRRLETNLKLQEERIVEMTVDLETLAAEKHAMVGDCADAREARDYTLSRVDQLEVEMERLEARGENQEMPTAILVELIFTAMNRARFASEKAHATMIFAQSQQQKVEQIRLESACQGKQQSSVIQDLNTQLSAREMELRQCIVSVAVCKGDYDRATRALALIRQQRDRLLSEVERLSSTASRQAAAFSTEFIHLQSVNEEQAYRLSNLSDVHEDLQRSRNVVIQKEDECRAIRLELSEVEARLSLLGQENEALLQARAKDDSQAQSEQHEIHNLLKEKYDEVRTRLSDAKEQHDSLQRVYEEEALRHSHVLSGLNERIAAIPLELERLQGVEVELEALKEKHSSQLHDLQSQMDTKTNEAAILEAEKAKLEQLHQDAVDALHRAQTESQEGSRTSYAIQQQLEEKIKNLEGTIAVQAGELEQATGQIEAISQQFAMETGARLQAAGLESRTIEGLKQELEEAAQILEALRRDAAVAQDELASTHSAMKNLRDEKQQLQEEITALEATNQRSASLHRHLETQIRDG